MKEREQQIEHWMGIAAMVFRAEDAIKGEWFPRLQATKDLPQEEKSKIADDYLRALAAEIIEGSERR